MEAASFRPFRVSSKTDTNSLGGAIAHRMRQIMMLGRSDPLRIEAIGAGAVAKTIYGTAVARKFLRDIKHPDIWLRVDRDEARVEGGKLTRMLLDIAFIPEEIGRALVSTRRILIRGGNNTNDFHNKRRAL